ncbi:MAG: phosphoglycolate phosphatase [Pseudomonadota bacterium]
MTASASDRLARWPHQHRAYFFDLDGTLVDSAPDLHAALNAALRQFDFEPVTLAATRDWVGQGARRLLHRAASAQRLGLVADTADQPLVPESELPMDAMQACFLDHYGRAIAALSTPFPGVLEALGALRNRDAGLAVVTNKPEALARKLLIELDMAHYFGSIVGADTTPETKPSALPAQRAATDLGVAAESVLFVGDSAADVGCARAFGCPVVALSYGYTQGVAPEALGADAVIDSFEALL